MKRENISTRHPIFCRMQEDFTEGINDALKRMLKNGVNEGRVTCTLDINLFRKGRCLTGKRICEALRLYKIRKEIQCFRSIRDR